MLWHQRVIGAVRDDRQYLNIDSVELIEACPSTRGGETFEEFTNHNIVHTIGAIEDHTLLGESFSQILGSLCLSCSCWSCRCTSQIKLKSSHKSHVAFICEGGNNESESITQVFVTVRKVGLNTFNSAVIFFPIVSELGNPFKSIYVLNVELYQCFNNIFSMYINSNKCTKCDTLKLGQFLSHKLYSFKQLGF